MKQNMYAMLVMLCYVMLDIPSYGNCLSFLLLVSSASMTRLVRSRTASGSSIASCDSSRSRSHANDHQPVREHTDVSMENVSNSTVDQTVVVSSSKTEDVR